ncbi:MAG: B12-binding domain-containing protein [Anaerolineales bacterium]|nr:B12-binding domain-containing protein [Anaerolineales bacterium]
MVIGFEKTQAIRKERKSITKGDFLTRLKEQVENGEREKVITTVHTALDQGISVHEILTAISQALDVVGRKYQNQEYYLPQLIMSASTA